MSGNGVRASGVILAAGRGERLGAPRNKALVELAGKALLRWCAEAFVASGAMGELVVVARPEDEREVEACLSGLPLPWRVVEGGERRQDSSLAGVTAARGDYVLIHDAARPLVSAGLIARVLEATVRHRAAAPGIPMRDTLRYAEGGFLVPGSPRRAGLWAMQTPQGFERELVLRALREAGAEITDDAEAVLALGQPVALVPGEVRNLKITYPEDLGLAELIAAGLRGRP